MCSAGLKVLKSQISQANKKTTAGIIRKSIISYTIDEAQKNSAVCNGLADSAQHSRQVSDTNYSRSQLSNLNTAKYSLLLFRRCEKDNFAPEEPGILVSMPK